MSGATPPVQGRYKQDGSAGMDVWIVEAGLAYEPGSIMGVYSSQELADKMVDKLEKETCYDWVGSTRHTVDYEADRISHIT